MGIGRVQARALLAALKSGTATRQAWRSEVGDAITIMQEFAAKYDALVASSARDFAVSRPAQYQTFVDAIPDPTVDQTP